MIKKLVSKIGKVYFSSPLVANIQLTNRCQLNCPFCFVSKEDPIDMKIEELKRQLVELKQMGCRTVVFGNGEPMLYPQIFEAVRLSKLFGFEVRIATSGSACTYNSLRRLKGIGLDLLTVSLNSVNREINELSRDGYKLAINAIRIACSLELNFSINYVALENNVSHFSELIQYANKFGAKSILIMREKVNSYGDIGYSYSMSSLNRLVENIRDSSVPIQVEACFCELTQLIHNKGKGPLQGCAAGRVIISILASGRYGPCSHLYSKHEYADSIFDYWEGTSILDQLRSADLTSSPCGICVNSELCCPCQALFPDVRDIVYHSREKCVLFAEKNGECCNLEGSHKDEYC